MTNETDSEKNIHNQPQTQFIQLTHIPSNGSLDSKQFSDVRIGADFANLVNRSNNLKNMKDVEADEYDPFSHRKVERPTTNMDTAIHLLKGCIGNGIFAMPEAFKHAGLMVGTIGLGAIGIICLYTMHILLNCARELCRRTKTPFLNFAQVGELACVVGPPFLRPFSEITRILIDAVLCFTQIGSCCVYYVFVATNLQQLIHEQFQYDVSVQTILTILLLPLIFLNWIRNLKLLTPFNMVGNVFMGVGLGIIFYYIFQDIQPIGSRPNFHVFFSSWAHIPLYFGSALYAFEGIVMILPLENKMKTPQDFGGWSGVLNRSMFIVILLHIAVGFFGYLKFGAESAGSITLNLPHGEWLAMSVRLVMSLSIFLSYALQFYIPISITWPVIEPRLPKRGRVFFEYTYRTTLVILTFALAVMIPDLGLFITLVGALCSSALALILPSIFSLCCDWEDGYGKLNWKLWKNVGLIAFGLVGCVTGTFVSILQIIAHEETSLPSISHGLSYELNITNQNFL